MTEDINPPPIEPVSLAEAKTFIRVDHTDEDTLIALLIKSARERLEEHLGLALITRAIRTTRPANRRVLLPRYPIISVEGVRVGDADVTDYRAELRSRPARIEFPFTPGAAVTVDYTAGYGEAPSDVPTPLRQAILLLVAQGYENREGARPDHLPLMVDALTGPYRGVGL